MSQTIQDPYFIDFSARIRRLQAIMAQQGIDVYLGSRLRSAYCRLARNYFMAG